MANEVARNAVDREVPTVVNGRPQIPYQGVGGHRPEGVQAAPPIRTAADFPADGDKRVAGLREIFERAGIRDGAWISTHHHFRNGDLLANQVFEAAASLGLRDLVWMPSSVFPCHAPVIDHLRSGVVHHIEAGLNGPVGEHVSHHGMRGTGVLRSHGGRAQAIKDGEAHVDLCFVAAPAADCFGNANGVGGPNPCGPLGYSRADALYADHTAVVTDHLVPFPCIPWEIEGKLVDWVVEIDRVGDPDKIVFGTTKITEDPRRLQIASLAADFARTAGIIRDGWSFQSGASGIALAITKNLTEIMKEDGIRARFLQAGSTFLVAEMLQEGLVDYVLDGQSFDLDGIRSLRDDPRHLATSPFTSYDYHAKGDFMALVDAVFLGATEVDRHFRANVATHSDGRLLHGVGGWQNCLSARNTILIVPSARRGGPILVDDVTTVCGPGELIDAVVTERGIAINPRRQDLIDATRGSGLPVRAFEEIQAEAVADVGPRMQPDLEDETVAVVKWVDGTVIDAVRRVGSRDQQR